MKIIRPEQPETKKELIQKMTDLSQEMGMFDEVESRLFIDNKEVKPLPIKVEMNYVDDKTNPIDYIMDEVIDENTNKITFSITLTKKQYELYTRKGGICWLKKALVGQQNKKRRK